MNQEMPAKAQDLFFQACNVSKRLALLSECLQDHLEDRPAHAQAAHAGGVNDNRAAISVIASDICSTGLQIVVALSGMLESHLRHSGRLSLDDAVATVGQDLLEQVDAAGNICLELTRIGLQSDSESARFSQLLQLASQARDVLARVQSGTPGRTGSPAPATGTIPCQTFAPLAVQ
ncbi:MAG: hypothetical protein R3E99_13225 [Burkholderiaceae bacterium]